MRCRLSFHSTIFQIKVLILLNVSIIASHNLVCTICWTVEYFEVLPCSMDGWRACLCILLVHRPDEPVHVLRSALAKPTLVHIDLVQA